MFPVSVDNKSPNFRRKFLLVDNFYLGVSFVCSFVCDVYSRFGSLGGS